MQHCEKILASPFSARREPWCSRGCKVTLPSAHEETELHSKIASLLVPLPREAEISRLFVKKKKKKSKERNLSTLAAQCSLSSLVGVLYMIRRDVDTCAVCALPRVQLLQVSYTCTVFRS